MLLVLRVDPVQHVERPALLGCPVPLQNRYSNLNFGDSLFHLLELRRLLLLCGSYFSLQLHYGDAQILVLAQLYLPEYVLLVVQLFLAGHTLPEYLGVCVELEGSERAYLHVIFQSFVSGHLRYGQRRLARAVAKPRCRGRQHCVLALDAGLDHRGVAGERPKKFSVVYRQRVLLFCALLVVVCRVV